MLVCSATESKLICVHIFAFRKESKLICIVCRTESAELDEVFTISLWFKCCISYHWVFHLRSKDTVTSIATRPPAGHPKGAGYEIYLCTEPAVGTTQPPLHWILRGLLSNLWCSWNAKHITRAHTVEVKNAHSCSSRPPYAFVVCIYTTIPLL